MQGEFNSVGNHLQYRKKSIVFLPSFNAGGRKQHSGSPVTGFGQKKRNHFLFLAKLWFTKERWKLKALLIYHVKQRVIFLPLLCFHIIMLTACMGGIKEFLNKNNNFLLSTFIIHISRHPAGRWCRLPVTLHLFFFFCTPLICLAQLRAPLIAVPAG